MLWYAFHKSIWVTVSDICGIWPGCPTHSHHGLYKQTNLRTNQLLSKNRSWVNVGGQSTCLLKQSFYKLYHWSSTKSLCLWMFCRSVGVGSPPGGPGGEAEELTSSGSAYRAHTIAHRQRQGKVFCVIKHLFSLFLILKKCHKEYVICGNLWCVCCNSPPKQKRLNIYSVSSLLFEGGTNRFFVVAD